MLCPYCNTEDSRVIDSRAVDDGRAIRRRRGCNNCGKRFTTFETVEQLPLMVVKHDGTRQIFDRNKLLNGLIRACDKREKSLESMLVNQKRICEKQLNFLKQFLLTTNYMNSSK